jgi:hypothetical protein
MAGLIRLGRGVPLNDDLKEPGCWQAKSPMNDA